MFRLLRPLHQVSRRTISSSAPRHLENKVPAKQKMFQKKASHTHLRWQEGEFWTGIVDEQIRRQWYASSFEGRCKRCSLV
ncbi:uncharacterized protein LOC127411002 isoform X2 [Myxocyprinus asiaticus]|uniref:uncharacterized protein LOC127411002 isoform X2 n=1 Tax=Myxocyprinus asiaticus TaxID=70543 RepID=UPI00222154D7|nr:uncharacterized protein LOC127411002 isoform X2 [Myxocyprinus asiaticus]